jgi:hypothetical protein
LPAAYLCGAGFLCPFNVFAVLRCLQGEHCGLRWSIARPKLQRKDPRVAPISSSSNPGTFQRTQFANAYRKSRYIACAAQLESIWQPKMDFQSKLLVLTWLKAVLSRSEQPATARVASLVLLDAGPPDREQPSRADLGFAAVETEHRLRRGSGRPCCG